uniref:protein FAR1-RELATED SEQUENCE 11-like n=1 Tax=Erigeron canadensis TaxID=72917 RepID=UPI001CB9113B|nr:protein FAR1-RELATED SEQUENCE 11-like [Erigeron canadensis]
MELQKQVKHGELPFMDRDIHNLFAKMKTMVGANDAMKLMEYMETIKEQNSRFQCAYNKDKKRRLENLFWCHSHSLEWFEKYGDVVVFDTTYKVNAYDMPCGIFVGVNNHGKTVLFGNALLRKETIDTFRWLMKTSVTIMEKMPKTIITDQDLWMSEAIADEMPTTKHSYCIWHITSRFSCWFSALLRTKYQRWCGDFYKLYKMTSIEEFEDNWSLIDIAVQEIINVEERNNMSSIVRPTSSNIKSPLEEQAYGILTPFAFKKFQELQGSNQYLVVHVEE